MLEKTTILNFRHLLERYRLGQVLFERIKNHLADEDLMLKRGRILDASILAGPPWTKNRKREWDPEMQQTRKGNQWPLGMKLHMGVDAQSGLVHSLATNLWQHACAERFRAVASRRGSPCLG